ncbi:hypothetical protein HDU76_007683 [Blyttiomyces sp. JEL0837]|nr:hypothetical protein HDU76_007683 [Blyttiomyces sp. JEL0837]
MILTMAHPSFQIRHHNSQSWMLSAGLSALKMYRVLGRVTLDWDSLPPNIAASVPGAPSPYKKKVREKASSPFEEKRRLEQSETFLGFSNVEDDRTVSFSPQDQIFPHSQPIVSTLPSQALPQSFGNPIMPPQLASTLRQTHLPGDPAGGNVQSQILKDPQSQPALSQSVLYHLKTSVNKKDKGKAIAQEVKGVDAAEEVIADSQGGLIGSLEGNASNNEDIDSILHHLYQFRLSKQSQKDTESDSKRNEIADEIDSILVRGSDLSLNDLSSPHLQEHVEETKPTTRSPTSFSGSLNRTSTHSKREDGNFPGRVSTKRVPISLRPTDAQLRRKQSDLSMVSAELCDLSVQLEGKNREITEKEQELLNRERTLVLAEERMEDRIAELVTERVAAHQAVLKKQIETLVGKYEDRFETLSKENKRLIVTNKELVTKTRQAREELKHMKAELEDRDAQIIELQHQGKSLRDRIDRLKSKVNEVKPATIVIDRSHPSFSKPVVGNRRSPFEDRDVAVKSTRHVMTQTFTRRADSPRKESETDQSQVQHVVPPELLRLSDHLLRAHHRGLATSFVRNDDGDVINIFANLILKRSKSLCQDIGAAFPIFASNNQQHSIVNNTESTIEDQEDSLTLSDLFFQLVLDFQRCLGEGCRERFVVAEAAYKYMTCRVHAGSNETLLDLMDPRQRVLVRLIVVAGMGQPEVLEVVLNGILIDLGFVLAKSAFLDVHGLEFIHPILRSVRSHGRVQFLASAVLFNMCGDGDWLDEFLIQCGDSEDFLDSAAIGLTVPNIAARENVSVVLQKMSRVGGMARKFRSNTILLKRIRDLVDGQEEGVSEYTSDFLDLNLRSILQNIE